MDMDWNSHIVLACITCEEVALITTDDQFLRVKGYDDRIVNLFLPTVCFDCEQDGRRKVAEKKSDKEGTTPMWVAVSISWNIIRFWQPYVAMVAYLRDMSIEKPKVNLVRRDQVKDLIESKYSIQSVILSESSGKPVRVLPYLRGGFF